MSRRSERIDYRTFNSTGDIVRHPDNIQTQFQHLTILDTPLVESLDQSSDNTMVNPSEDAIEMMLMAQEVVDFIDENPITGMAHDELNSSINI